MSEWDAGEVEIGLQMPGCRNLLARQHDIHVRTDLAGLKMNGVQRWITVRGNDPDIGGIQRIGIETEMAGLVDGVRLVTETGGGFADTYNGPSGGNVGTLINHHPGDMRAAAEKNRAG